MQTKSIVVNCSKTVQTMDGCVVSINMLRQGLFRIDDYYASEVFVLCGDKNMLFACGVNFSSAAINPIAGDPLRGLVCRFEINLNTLVDLIPQTPTMNTPNSLSDSQGTQSF